MEFESLLYMYLAMSISGAVGGAWRLLKNPIMKKTKKDDKLVVITREIFGGLLAGVMGGGLVTLYTCHVPWVLSVSLLCGVCYDEVFACGLNIIKKVVSMVLRVGKIDK